MRAAALLLAIALGACATQPHGAPGPHHPPPHSRSIAEVYDKRPWAWCGWWLRKQMASDPGPDANRALWWASFGAPAPGPAPGVIVIWRRRHCPGCGHVGIIIASADKGLWLVRSGNDGHAVRTRPRSVAGAFAFRWPH